MAFCPFSKHSNESGKYSKKKFSFRNVTIYLVVQNKKIIERLGSILRAPFLFENCVFQLNAASAEKKVLFAYNSTEIKVK